MASAGSGKTKSGRNIQFNFQQNQVLVTMVLQHYDLLFGAKAQKTTSSRKKEIWRSISENVSAEGNNLKTVDNCKKRFSDIKRILKAKVAREKKAAREAGGGKPYVAELSTYENLLMERLGENLLQGLDVLTAQASTSKASAVATQPLPVIDTGLIDTDSSHSFSSATTLPDIMCSTPDPGVGQTTVEVRRAMGPAPTSSISSSSSSSGTERCHQLSEELTIVVRQIQESLYDESQDLIGSLLNDDTQIESYLEDSAAAAANPAAHAAAPGPAAPGPAPAAASGPAAAPATAPAPAAPVAAPAAAPWP
ncbi:myb-related transcription factor, partner of profilin-like [Bombina bombina]|uniref:myb-related transcription factor, partner of profilin-like n=1 Tax=Bombina bombina TaxID=8345 RepID=UPI00235AAD8F|nr:myb-related transcription factor, partner of profilin-like [Bombina bombina]